MRCHCPFCCWERRSPLSRCHGDCCDAGNGVALANFAFLPLIQELFNGLYTIVPAEFLDSPQGHEMRAQLRFSQWSALLTAGISAVAFAILHGWLVVKLRRPEIRRQFH